MESVEKRRVRQKRYRDSAKGQATALAYRQTETYRTSHNEKARRRSHTVEGRLLANERQRRYEASKQGREYKRRYRRSAKFRVAQHRFRTSEKYRTYLVTNREVILARQRDRHRASWHRLGRGVHMARVHDWAAFFDGLANDVERTVAGHVMLCLAPFDPATAAVTIDPWFDYNHLADAIEIPSYLTELTASASA